MKIKHNYMIIFAITLWIIGFFCILILLSKLFTPKFLFNLETASPETEIWESFYSEPKNSIDVLFVGSSHIYQGVNPVVFEKETGLKAFDLASSSQDNATSYFYIKEALRFQRPRLIVLDVGLIGLEPLVAGDRYPRSLENMKWSAVKIEAVNAWAKANPEIKMVNRLFPILDYHERWKQLSKTDFSYSEHKVCEKGFIPMDISIDTEHIKFYNEYNPFTLSDRSLEYFTRIVNLCKDENIILILICTPHALWDYGMSESVDRLAADNGLIFIEYNNEHFDDIDLDANVDWYNDNHLNKYGAEKFTKVLAEDLRECLYAQ